MRSKRISNMIEIHDDLEGDVLNMCKIPDSMNIDNVHAPARMNIDSEFTPIGDGVKTLSKAELVAIECHIGIFTESMKCGNYRLFQDLHISDKSKTKFYISFEISEEDFKSRLNSVNWE